MRRDRATGTRPGRTSERRGAPLVIMAAVVLALAGAAAPAAATTQAPAHPPVAEGSVFLVQALPGADVSVSVDGADPRTGIATAQIVGPLDLSPGEHTLTVTGQDPDWTMQASVDITPGQSVDVVLHRPAKASGRPMVTVFHEPVGGVAAGNGRVLVAHTATAPPADVEVDGEVAFADIANGEYASADVPAGTHVVRVVPAGRSGPSLLGPLDLDARAGQLTAVYAVGNPQDDTMDVVVHRQPLGARGSSAPDAVETGSAGLVADVPVAGATAQSAAEPLRSSPGAGVLAALVLSGLVAVVVIGRSAATVPRRRRTVHRHRLT